MNDYSYPSIYLAYLFFATCFGLALYFFIRSFRDGYWGPEAEEVKYRMLDEK